MRAATFLFATVSLLVTLGAALPQTDSGGGSDDVPCPLIYPCSDISIVTSYCANNTDPAVETGGTFDSTEPIECVCGSEVLGDESGGYAALECLTCNSKLTDDAATLLTLWLYTCYTAEQEDVDAALDCWNSGGDDCPAVPSNKAKMPKKMMRKRASGRM